MHYLPDPQAARRMTTSELRERFLVSDLFRTGEISVRAIDLDRAVIGSAVPSGSALRLQAPDILAADYFTQRRELGVLNIGGAGRVIADGETHGMQPKDGLYIGRGCRDIVFESMDEHAPARFYLVSYPAHADYPTTHVAHAAVTPLQLGESATANRRRLYKYFHPHGVGTAQLVMGITKMEDGSVWNTMPPHTHARRSEVYMYFDLPGDAVVMHLMGEPQETRNLVVRDGDVVLSPGWSIHAGCGTRSYSFCWAMGGENQDFTDMQAVATGDLR